MDWQAFFVLLVVGLLYLVIIWLTYSWMIAAPRRWLLESQIDRLKVAVTVAERIGRDVDRDITAALKARLKDLEESLKDRGGPVKRSFNAVHLNELMATQQTLNGLSRHQAVLVPDGDLPSSQQWFALSPGSRT